MNGWIFSIICTDMNNTRSTINRLTNLMISQRLTITWRQVSIDWLYSIAQCITGSCYITLFLIVTGWWVSWFVSWSIGDDVHVFGWSSGWFVDNWLATDSTTTVVAALLLPADFALQERNDQMWAFVFSNGSINQLSTGIVAPFDEIKDAIIRIACQSDHTFSSESLFKSGPSNPTVVTADTLTLMTALVRIICVWIMWVWVIVVVVTRAGGWWYVWGAWIGRVARLMSLLALNDVV